MAFRPKHNPWAIALTVTLATIMEVLDTSIANVALPHIAGSLGASQDQATWVITSYLVSNAVVLPIAAYLASLIGRKKFYMSCVALFGISSVLCGLAPSLPLLLFFRVLQGAGGGGLAPSEQSILADTFPPGKRGQAFAVYGLAVVTAPILGPTLGGWITDNYDWRWIFFINVPVALLSLFLTHRLVEDPPHIQEEVKAARNGKFKMDYVGFGFVALAFGSLEVILDKGQEDDWFNSHFITIFAILAVIGFACMITWELWVAKKGERPIVDLRLFANKGFAIAFCMMLALGFTLYATTVMLPQILQELMGYTAQLAGMALSSGGLATLLTMPIAGALVARVDPRKIIIFGFLSLSAGLFYLAHVDLAVSFTWVAKARFLQSLGVGFLFVPINTLAYVGTKRENSNDVSGLVNLARNMGGSLGTSFVSTFVARWGQRHQVYLAHHVSQANPAWRVRFQAMTAQAHATVASNTDAQHHALARYYQSGLRSQAQLLAYIDITHFLAFALILVAPVALLMTRPPKGTQAAAH
ncbi:MAG: DHA2 family efflux MFS transporter permease subunit [Acidobacteriaceae bacterium]|nr:DHA2 family efflux MFS transporter permease subunit [Acidobacteriaceae bacterium]